MPARAIGTSTIAFGLVSLPVKIYSAGESSRKVSFNMIWKERGVRVRQQYIDPADGTVVPREEIVKGYEFSKGQYVLFTKEELEVVEAPKSDEIEIVSFVPADTVDRLLFNKAYYLGPDKGGARAYRLLGAALRETERVAIAKHATRGKQYIVMIRPHDEGLLMEQLWYEDEIRAFGEVPQEEGEVNEAELGLAAVRGLVRVQDEPERLAADAIDPALASGAVTAFAGGSADDDTHPALWIAMRAGDRLLGVPTSPVGAGLLERATCVFEPALCIGGTGRGL